MPKNIKSISSNIAKLTDLLVEERKLRKKEFEENYKLNQKRDNSYLMYEDELDEIRSQRRKLESKINQISNKEQIIKEKDNKKKIKEQTKYTSAGEELLASGNLISGLFFTFLGRNEKTKEELIKEQEKQNKEELKQEKERLFQELSNLKDQRKKIREDIKSTIISQINPQIANISNATQDLLYTQRDEEKYKNLDLDILQTLKNTDNTIAKIEIKIKDISDILKEINNKDFGSSGGGGDFDLPDRNPRRGPRPTGRPTGGRFDFLRRMGSRLGGLTRLLPMTPGLLAVGAGISALSGIALFKGLNADQEKYNDRLEEEQKSKVEKAKKETKKQNQIIRNQVKQEIETIKAGGKSITPELLESYATEAEKSGNRDKAAAYREQIKELTPAAAHSPAPPAAAPPTSTPPPPHPATTPPPPPPRAPTTTPKQPTTTPYPIPSELDKMERKIRSDRSSKVNQQLSSLYTSSLTVKSADDVRFGEIDTIDLGYGNFFGNFLNLFKPKQNIDDETPHSSSGDQASPTAVPAPAATQSTIPPPFRIGGNYTTKGLTDYGLTLRPFGDVHSEGAYLDQNLVELSKQLPSFDFTSISESGSRLPLRFESITGLNDAYHKTLPYKSKHTEGKAVDFTLNRRPTKEEGEKLVELLKSKGFSKVIDEYNDRSPGSNGGHIHAEVAVTSTTPKSQSTEKPSPFATPSIEGTSTEESTSKEGFDPIDYASEIDAMLPELKKDYPMDSTDILRRKAADKIQNKILQGEMSPKVTTIVRSHNQKTAINQPIMMENNEIPKTDGVALYAKSTVNRDLSTMTQQPNILTNLVDNSSISNNTTSGQSGRTETKNTRPLINNPWDYVGISA
jgi:hypothetical protein